MKQRALVLFFVLAFVLPWAVWGTTLLQQRGSLGFHVPSSLAFWLGLTIATYVTAAVTGGWHAVKDLLLRLVRVNVSWQAYAAALLLTPAIAVVAVLLGRAMGASAGVGVDVAAGALPGVLALNLWLFLITEETAWRGFALPRLQAGMRPVPAALLLGLLWGLWHIPLFFMEGSFQSRIPFVGFMVSILATSVIVSWVFNHARGSVLLAAVFHAVTDVTIAYTGLMSSGTLLFWLFVALQCVVAAVLATRMPASAAAQSPLAYERRSTAPIGVVQTR